MAAQHAKQFKNGATAARTAITPILAEPVWDSATNDLYVGDNAVAGGILIGGASAPAHNHANKTNLDLIPAVLGGALTHLRVNAAGTALEFAAPTTAFTGLTDTPANFTGAGLQVARVNAGASAIEFHALTAADIANVAAGNLAATDMQAAVNELQGDLDLLNTINATDLIAGAGAPGAGAGIDGQFYMNVTNGDLYGPKAAGAWGAVIGNAYDQLGLSGTAGAAPAAAGAAGTATIAARGDHVHPFQAAADTANTAAGAMTATNVDAALAQLEGFIAANTTAQHTHANKAAIDTIPTPLIGEVNQVITVTGAGTYGVAVVPSAPVTSIFGLVGVVGVNDLTAVTTHDGAADYIIIETAAGPRRILVDDLMDAGTLP